MAEKHAEELTSAVNFVLDFDSIFTGVATNPLAETNEVLVKGPSIRRCDHPVSLSQ
jgi:hypothetical protein